ncbi:hypothetical protein EDB85DRAFT_526502 [Lactarius pseudohatsudake]|nr:hypothetical protein EDB85DRAFT_526502 [Lactarius pseudohatsudake]
MCLNDGWRRISTKSDVSYLYMELRVRPKARIRCQCAHRGGRCSSPQYSSPAIRSPTKSMAAALVDFDLESGAPAFEREIPQSVHEPISTHGEPEEGNPNMHSVPSRTVDPPAQAAATFVDGSNLLFSMYNETTAEHDRKVAENWRSDADSAVVVNGLFSVMVTILLGRSYQDLRLKSQDVSAFYLSQIYQLSAGQNGTSTPLPFKVSDPSTFSPASSSVRSSALWTLSLVISLACTVIATLLRQWARRYLHITQEPRGSRNRARIRELIVQGVEREQLQRMSSVLPGLFHLSVFLFLSGLVHSSNNNAVDLVILSITFICVGLYCFASIIPLSPLISYTPLTSFSWFSWSRIVSLTYELLYDSSIRLPFVRYHTQRHLWELARAHLSWTLRDTAVDMDKLARKHSSSLDTSVVSRVFDSLDGHEDLEQFLSAIPGFYNSSEVKKDVSVLERLNDKILAPAITSFMDRSLSSNLLTKPKKQQRITICLQAMNADPLLLQCTFSRSLQSLNSDIFECIDFVRLALEYLHRDDSDPWVKDYAQCIVAVAINRVHLDDGAWIDIAWRYLGPDHAKYRWEGHNLRLCNLMYLTQQLKGSQLENSDQFEQGGIWRNVLAEALKFEIMNTVDDLQNEFCRLLNELDSMALGRSQITRSNARLVLSSICTTFVPLREGTATPSTGVQGPVLQWLTSYLLRSRSDLGVGNTPAGIPGNDYPRDTEPGPARTPPHLSPIQLETNYPPPDTVPRAAGPPPHGEQSQPPMPPSSPYPPSPIPETDSSRPRDTYAHEPRHEMRPPSLHSGITLFRLLRLPFNFRRNLP